MVGVDPPVLNHGVPQSRIRRTAHGIQKRRNWPRSKTEREEWFRRGAGQGQAVQ
jgi:hypothetical protein